MLPLQLRLKMIHNDLALHADYLARSFRDYHGLGHSR
jgi:hypothetical protein